MTQNLRTDLWYKINLGLEHLHQPLLDILHNANNDPRYNGVPENQHLLHQQMSGFKQTHQGALRNVIRADQWELLCPTNGQTSDSKQWDVTLIIVVCKHLLNLPQQLLNIIEDVRKTRNKVKHKTLFDLQKQAEFVPLWNDIRGILVRCNYNKLNDFDELGKGVLGFYESDVIRYLKITQKQLQNEMQALKYVTYNEACFLNQKIDIQRCNVTQAILQLRRDFSDITEKQYEEITSNFGKLTTQLSTVEKEFDLIKHRMVNGEKTVNTLEDKADNLEETVDILNDKAENIDETVILLRDKADNLEETVDVLKDKTDNIDETVDVLKDKTDNIDETVNLLRDKADNIDERVVKLECKKKAYSLNGCILDEVVNILLEKLSTEEMKTFIQTTDPVADLSRYLQKQRLEWDVVEDELMNIDKEDLIDLIKSKTDVTKGLQRAIKNFKEDIQKSFLQRFSMKPFLNRDGSNSLDEIDIQKSYVELAIIKDDTTQLTTNYDVVEELDNHWKSLANWRQVVSLEDIASISMEKKFIFIEGIAGIGKSTLVKKMVSDWYEGLLFNEKNENRVHFLLPIICRELNNQYDDIPDEKAEDLLKRIFPELPDLEILQRFYCNVLILVDGIDELRDINDIENGNLQPKVNLVFKLLDRKFMKQFQCIMVGRPNTTNQLNTFRERNFRYPTTKIQVCGFNKNSAKEFVYKQLEGHDQEIADGMLEQIEQSKVVKQMSTIPLYMQILVSIFKDDPLGKLPSRSTQLLLYCVLIFWRNHCEKKTDTPKIGLRNFIKTVNLTKFMGIFKFAYETLIEREIIFEADECEVFNELVEMGILLKSAKGESDITTYQFLHLTFQELFAAFHILCSESDPHITHPVLKNVLIIAAGFQGISCGNGDAKDSMLYYFLKEMKQTFRRDILVENLKTFLGRKGLYVLTPKSAFIDLVFENQDIPEFFLQQNNIVFKIDTKNNWNFRSYSIEGFKMFHYMINLISNSYPDFRLRAVKSIDSTAISSSSGYHLKTFIEQIVNLTKELYIVNGSYLFESNNVVSQFTQQLKSANKLTYFQLIVPYAEFRYNTGGYLTDQHFSVLLDSLLHVESINLRNNDLTQLSLYRLLKSLKLNSKLKELDFSRNKFVDYIFDEIDQSSTKLENKISIPVNLRKLSLSECSLTDEHFPELLESLVHVESIDLSDNMLTKLSFFRLLKRLNQDSYLKEIDFSLNSLNDHFHWTQKSNTEHVEEIAIDVNLRKVSLRYCFLTDKQFSVLLDTLVNVESIDVKGNQLTPSSLYHLCRRLTPVSKLKEIDISHNYLLEDHFEQIDISNIEYENFNIRKLSLSSCLLEKEELIDWSINEWFYPSPTDEQFHPSPTDERFSVLLDLLIHVESIDVSSNDLTQSSFYCLLKRLSPDSPLIELDFSYNKFVDNFNWNNHSDAEHENQTPIAVNLRTLSISSCWLTDEKISPELLDSLVHVESIDVSYNELTQVSLYRLFKLVTLKKIDFSYNDFVDNFNWNNQLDAEHENQTPIDVNLRKLTLSYCCLTDEKFLELLKPLVHVESVDLDCNKLTQVSLFRLLRSLRPDSLLNEIDFSDNKLVKGNFDEIDGSQIEQNVGIDTLILGNASTGVFQILPIAKKIVKNIIL